MSGLQSATVLVAGVAALISSTVLGWVALRRLRRLAGSSDGLEQAMVDALLVPALFLAWLSWRWWQGVIGLLLTGDVSDPSEVREMIEYSLRINQGMYVLAGSLITDAVLVIWLVRKVWAWVKGSPRREAARPRLSPQAVGSFACLTGSFLCIGMSGVMFVRRPAAVFPDGDFLPSQGLATADFLSPGNGYLVLGALSGLAAAGLGIAAIRRNRLAADRREGLWMAVLATAAYPVGLELWLMWYIWPPLVELVAGRDHTWVAILAAAVPGGLLGWFLTRWLWQRGQPAEQMKAPA